MWQTFYSVKSSNFTLPSYPCTLKNTRNYKHSTIYIFWMLCVTHQNYSLFMIKYGCTIYIIVLADIIAKVVKSEGSPYDHREEEFDERLWWHWPHLLWWPAMLSFILAFNLIQYFTHTLCYHGNICCYDNVEFLNHCYYP